jgi:hypothetical protein
MSPLFVVLFNYILDHGVIPDAWLIGTIKPIYKNKGSPKDPVNYRPITILSCLGKIFTSILNTRINTFLFENNLLNENQAGFREHYSTTDHIFSLHFLIEKIRSEKKKLFCSFIDFSAAFDSIWRAGLWCKLLKLGITGKILTVIKKMYDDIKSCVSLNGKTSAFFSSGCGVRQGENLSPILFSMYLNDLEEFLLLNNNGVNLNFTDNDSLCLFKILVLLYADDTVLFAESESNFQKCLDSFHTYCKNWKLSINYSKTKVIVFGTNRPGNYSFNINGQAIETVSTYKYLGVLFSSSGSFLSCRKHLVVQANKAMHQILLKINNLSLPIDLQLKLFDHTILPILTYGCEVYGYENLDMIEQVHCNFLRIITKSRKSTPRYMLYAELGRYPLEIVIKTRMVKFWSKLTLTDNKSKISYLCYRYMLNSNHNFKWLKHVKSILDSTGHSYAWMNPPNYSLNINKLVKQTLIDQFYQNWASNLESSSKGRMYSLFKNTITLQVENYLKVLLPAQRLSLFHFRTGNHRLPIEVGRWAQNHVPHHERKCPLCPSNDLGDEMHYLLTCPFFNVERKKYIPSKYYQRPNIIKFRDLLSTNDTDLLVRLSYFVKKIIQQFSRN